MTILVLGNGFDLAHGLPTKYSHFLQFVQMFRDYGFYITNEKTIPEGNEFLTNCFSYIQRVYQPDNECFYRELDTYTNKHNILLNHFLKTYKKRCELGKEGWIDFEAEIADIVKLFYEARKLSIQKKNEGKESILPDNIVDRLTPFIQYSDPDSPSVADLRGKDLFPDIIEEQGKRLFTELNYITRLLEIYLTEIVSRQSVKRKIRAIADLKIDKVLSFNYTNTFQRLCDPDEKAEYCYIHGKAEEKGNLYLCNLVLGINEFLDDDRQNQDNAFVWFKKFYQRIIKETSSAYIDWLDDHILANERMDRLPPKQLEIYFYGHSLDVSDRDVLQRIILHDNAKVHFFYPDEPEKREMAKQISNLIKIVGEEKLIQMTRGKNRAIEFIPVL